MLQIRIPPQVRLLQHLCRDKWHEWMYIPPVFRAGCLKLVLMVDVRSMCLYQTLVGHVALSRQRYLTVAVLQVRHIFVAVGPGHGPIRGEILHETSREPLGRFAALQARMTGAEGAHEVKMLAIGAPCRDGRPHREDASSDACADKGSREAQGQEGAKADIATGSRAARAARTAARGQEGLLPGREVRGREDGELTPKYLCKYRQHDSTGHEPRLPEQWTDPIICRHDGPQVARLVAPTIRLSPVGKNVGETMHDSTATAHARDGRRLHGQRDTPS
ncbi:hypothetical protein ACCO45_011148 [Purpureocillium lilacinum]|uniref:Uncharacterized protein n=1 Tax=Purpureocillium lilacinum TaxID=33203 RepID=A0ACC4DGY5_PURLI